MRQRKCRGCDRRCADSAHIELLRRNEAAGSNQRLARTPYLAGHAVTAADLVVLPHVQSILRAASKDAARAFALPFLPLDATHPALAAWRDRMMALPYYARTVPPHWR